MQDPTNDDTGYGPRYSCACSACAGQGGALPVGQAVAALDALASPAVQSGNAAALLSGQRWSAPAAGAATVVSFSFSELGASYGSGSSAFAATLAPLTAQDRAQVREVLAAIEAVCNVRFVEIANDSAGTAMLRYAYSDLPNAMGHSGYAFFPSDAPQGGDVWIGSAQRGPEWVYYRPHLFLHETLHALGLQHPGSSGQPMTAQQDVIPHTAMSYSAIAGYPMGSLSRAPAEPMLADVLALQALYGSAAHNSGDTVYDLASRPWNDGLHVVWDSGGRDRLDASGAAGPVALDLREGASSDVGALVFAFGEAADGSRASTTYHQTVTIAAGCVIEDAAGSAWADTLVGNGRGNVLHGGAGSDSLSGGGGVDTASYDGARAAHRVTREGAQWQVRDQASGDVDTLQSIERLAFADGALALDLDGNAGQAAKLLGAVLGAQALADAALVGRTLGALDAGQSAQQLGLSLAQQALGAQWSHAALVQLLFGNVMGAADACADKQAHYLGLLDSQALSAADLVVMTADSQANQQQIGLLGLAGTGLAYLPAQ